MTAARWLALLALAVAPWLGAPSVSAQPQETCNAPVYLVVLVEGFDRERAAPYAQALRSTGIVAAHGGRYRAAGAPLAVLEGDWPADRAFVVEEYPCAERALAMWNSPTYQDQVKPARAGTGRYSVILMRAR